MLCNELNTVRLTKSDINWVEEPLNVCLDF